MKALLLLGLLLFTSPLKAEDAPNWQVDAAKSRLTFTARYGEDDVTGSFSKFTASIALAPEAPESGSIRATIAMDALTTKDYDAKENLPEEEWFDIPHHPTAEFVSTEISKDGKGGYIANGMLTIKEISKPLALPFTLNISEDGKTAVADGSATLSRLAYQIGQGEWEATDLLADDVHITLHIEATRKN